MTYTAPSGISAPRNNISGYKTRTVSNFTPEQMELFRMLLGGTGEGVQGGLGFLSKLAGGDEEAFAQAEAPAYSAYNRMLGQLGTRFSQFGARDSSAFQNATAGAGAQLAEDLQAQRLGLQQGAIERLLGLSQNLLQQQPYSQFFEKKQGFDWGSLGKLLGKGASAGLGFAFGGPAGAMVGSQIGKNVFG